jgi:hypothetical protein
MRDDEDDDGPAVNCQPIFVDTDSDEDQTQANGDAPQYTDWRQWDE